MARGRVYGQSECQDSGPRLSYSMSMAMLERASKSMPTLTKWLSLARVLPRLAIKPPLLVFWAHLAFGFYLATGLQLVFLKLTYLTNGPYIPFAAEILAWSFSGASLLALIATRVTVKRKPLLTLDLRGILWLAVGFMIHPGAVAMPAYWSINMYSGTQITRGPDVRRKGLEAARRDELRALIREMERAGMFSWPDRFTCEVRSARSPD